MPFRKCQAGPRKAYEHPPKIGSADDQNDLRNDNHRWHPNHNFLAITAVAWRRTFRRHRKQPSREIEGFRTGIVISSEMIPIWWLQSSFGSSTLSSAGVARSFKRASTQTVWAYVIFPMVEFSFSVLG